MEKKKKILKPIKPHRVGCLCCPGAKTVLPMDTVLYYGFGGWMITKDGEMFFHEEVDKEWEENRTLQYIENKAKRSSKSDWRAILDTALHGEVYQRQRGKWVLVEQNLGFA